MGCGRCGRRDRLPMRIPQASASVPRGARRKPDRTEAHPSGERGGVAPHLRNRGSPVLLAEEATRRLVNSAPNAAFGRSYRMFRCGCALILITIGLLVYGF